LHNKALLESAKTVCEKTIEDAAKEIHDIKQKKSNEVVDCAVSCDGSWQRRGF
jgi:ribosomal silencing factor RsfS